MRKGSLRKRRRADDEDEFDRPASSRPWWWRVLLRRPRDSIAVIVAVASVTAIVVNAAYLQHGRHPAPIFALRPLPVASAAPDVVGIVSRPHAASPEAARHDTSAAHAQGAENAKAASPPQAAAAARKDPIAELLTAHPAPAQSPPQQQPPVHQATLAPPRTSAEPPPRSLAQPSRQVLAVQRALSEFGYGQLKPTGIYDADTRVAVQRFEREHNLPVTDGITEPMKRALANLTGRSLD